MICTCGRSFSGQWIGSHARRFGCEPSIRERVKAQTDRTGECWLWTGASSANGYGQIVVRGRKMLAHRVSYEDARGPVPAGLELDHLCRKPLCVNPDHLEAVTHAENIRRGPGAKTECINGHPFDESNTGRQGAGYRYCRRCHADRESVRQGKPAYDPAKRRAAYERERDRNRLRRELGRR